MRKMKDAAEQFLTAMFGRTADPGHQVMKALLAPTHAVPRHG